MNRAPGTIWLLRKNDFRTYVQTGDADTIKIAFPDPEKDDYVYVHAVSRKDARLLAKRINECLDSTRKK